MPLLRSKYSISNEKYKQTNMIESDQSSLEIWMVTKWASTCVQEAFGAKLKSCILEQKNADFG